MTFTLFSKVLRSRLPESFEHVLAFNYIAYSMMSSSLRNQMYVRGYVDRVLRCFCQLMIYRLFHTYEFLSWGTEADTVWPLRTMSPRIRKVKSIARF